MVYLKNTVYEEDSQAGATDDRLYERLDALLAEAASHIRPEERICYAVARFSDNIEKFTDSLHYVSPFPDKVFAFREKGLPYREEVPLETAPLPQETETVCDGTLKKTSLYKQPSVLLLAVAALAVVLICLCLWIIY